MTSTIRRLALSLLFATCATSWLQAQSEKTVPLPAPQVQLSAAEKRFDQTVQTFEKHLYDSGAFLVDVTSKWTYSGVGNAQQGTNLFRLAVVKGGKYRIEAGSTEKGKAQYVCVSDAKEVTRVHLSAGYYSRQPVSPLHDDLDHDALTLQTLSGSGVELLIRPQMRAQLIAQIQGVQLMGEEQLGGRKVTRLQLLLVDKRVIDVWFTQDAKPLLVQLKTTETIPISDQQNIQLITTSTFDWKVGSPLPDSLFAAVPPAGAQRVDDLMTALREGEMRRLLGQQAPLLELSDTTGQVVRLADYVGKKVTVLIFWASWCAPSVNGMESLNAFVAEAQQKGAVVLAVNLGEPLQTVQAAVAEHKYQGRVLLDPETKSLDIYRLGELPTTILIGRDGTVQSFRSGSTTDARQLIRQDTATLLQGKNLVPR